MDPSPTLAQSAMRVETPGPVPTVTGVPPSNGTLSTWIATPAWNIGILVRSLVLVSQTPTFTPGLLLTATMR